MKWVAITGAAEVEPGMHWASSLCDLLVAAAEALLSEAAIGGLFVAAPSASFVDGQTNIAALLAARLALPRGAAMPLRHVELGDGSGAGALQAARAYTAAGICRSVMVVAGCKISDLSEDDRWRLLDGGLDHEAERALGLSYAALSGVLADLYGRSYGAGSADFSQVFAKNAGHAVRSGRTYLRFSPTPRELSLELSVARPLRRTDFAPLLDGACAVRIGELAHVEQGAATVEILASTTASDLSIVMDRKAPLAFDAVTEATRSALAGGSVAAAELCLAELDCSSSLLEVLGVEATGLVARGTALERYREGFGRLGSPCTINPSGGAQGRGHVYGASGIFQARELFMQLSGNAARAQVTAAACAGARALAVSISGLGTQAHALTCARVKR